MNSAVTSPHSLLGLHVGFLQFEEDEPPERELNETPKQCKERKRLESLQRNKERIEEELPNCKYWF